MSEKQKKMANRMVELLVEMNVLQKNGDTNYYGCLARLVDWKHYFTEAIGMYQSEEIEKDMKKYLEAKRKMRE